MKKQEAQALQDLMTQDLMEEIKGLKKQLEKNNEQIYALIKQQEEKNNSNSLKVLKNIYDSSFKKLEEFLENGIDFGKNLVVKNLPAAEIKKEVDKAVTNGERGAKFFQNSFHLVTSPKFYKAVARHDIESLKIMCTTAKTIYENLVSRAKLIKTQLIEAAKSKSMGFLSKSIAKVNLAVKYTIDYLKVKQEFLEKSSQETKQRSKEYEEYYKKAVSNDINISVKDVYTNMMNDMRKNGLTLKETIKMMQKADDQDMVMGLSRHMNFRREKKVAAMQR